MKETEELENMIREEIKITCLSNLWDERAKDAFIKGLLLFDGLSISTIHRIGVEIEDFAKRRCKFSPPNKALTDLLP